MQINLPWTSAPESHLGDPAYSLVESTGLRVGVGLTRADAGLICGLVNGEVLGAACDYVSAVDAFNAFETEHPNDSTKRWDVVYEAKCDALQRLREILQAQA